MFRLKQSIPLVHEAGPLAVALTAVKGAAKKMRDAGPPWWVGGPEAKEDQGIFFSSIYFNGVFELPSPRNAQRRD
jgi:hypothetical protein